MPKSDEQRKRLIEVSKKIMLLSRLDEVKREFSQELILQTINIRNVNLNIEQGGFLLDRAFLYPKYKCTYAA